MNAAGPGPILVTDGETRAVVATCRGLARAGHAVAAAAAVHPAPAHWSRSCDERLSLPHPLGDEREYVDALEQLLAPASYALLVPGSDAALRAISANRDRLEPHVRLGLPPHSAVVDALDKLRLVEVAESAGLAAPETRVCSGVDEALAAARGFGYPVLLKSSSTVYSVGSAAVRPESLRIDDPDRLARMVPLYGDPVLVQRSEPGSIVSYGGVFAAGSMRAAAVSRYVRTWRPTSGNVAFSVTIEPPAGLTDAVGRLLAALAWEGMFELELIARGDGSFAAIDLNPRPYGSLALAVEAGANIPAVWADIALGRDPEPVVARPGLRYRWEDADLLHLLWELRRGNLAAARAVARPHRRVVHPHFALADPGPLAARAVNLARVAVAKWRTPAPAGIATVTTVGAAPPAEEPLLAHGERTLAAAQGGGPPPALSDWQSAAGSRNGAPAPASSNGSRRPSRSNGPVAVIGAGPYGLAATAHLRAAGLPVLTFGDPLGFWRDHMPAGMMLRSRKRSSSISDPFRELTIDDYVRATARTVSEPSLTLDEFLDYGRWHQTHSAPEVDRRLVAAVDRAGDGFSLALDDGARVEAERVVVAAGLEPFGRRPEPFDAIDDELVSHASEHDDLAAFAGRQVAVVGGGQSALESAALLHEHGADVELLARKPIHWLGEGGSAPASRQLLRVPLPPTDVGGRVTGWLAAAPDAYRRVPARLQPEVSFRCIRPAGAGWLRPRLDGVALTTGHRVVAVERVGDGIRLTLDDGGERTFDHVLLGTGYAVDVRRYPFLSSDLRDALEVEDGYPRLRPGLESSVAGLHFVGAPAALSFGPVMRFVVGTWYAAPALARTASGRRQRPISFSF